MASKLLREKTALAASLSLMFPVMSFAQNNMQTFSQGLSGAASLAFVANDAGGDSDLDASLRFSGSLEKQVAPNLSVFVGLSQTTDTEETGEDNTGEYTLTISSSDLFAGARLTFNPEDDFQFYGKGGFLYYYSELELEESFFGLKEAGKVEEVEEGTGYLLGGGLSFKLNPKLQLDAEVTYLVRQEYFEDSNRSFDLEEIGALVGLRMKF
ncbi:MAG: porin family protein [Pseudomonadales bacterium]|nr:porin family protein [Pseudomonadales bacterium]